MRARCQAPGPGGGGPATGLNGSLFHLGDNGQVVGDEEKFTDKQVRAGLRETYAERT